MCNEGLSNHGNRNLGCSLRKFLFLERKERTGLLGRLVEAGFLAAEKI